MSETTKDELRKELNEAIGWPEDTNKELGRSNIDDNADWVIRRTHNRFGHPSWYAGIETNT